MASRVGEKFHFKIDGYTPESLPMARLAQYLADLSSLLGYEEKVHFIKVGKGSADLVHVVDEEKLGEVVGRLALVKQGVGPVEAESAFRSLNAKLGEDGKTAKMTRGRGKLLIFPGAAALPQTYGPIIQHGQLDGLLIRVGGKDGTKPIHIQNGDEYYICNANADIARRLAPAYEKFIRVYGNGRWFRHNDGKWYLDRFTINDFDSLDIEPLSDVVSDLRAIQGNGWQGVDDPLAELASIREGGAVG